MFCKIRGTFSGVPVRKTLISGSPYVGKLTNVLRYPDPLVNLPKDNSGRLLINFFSNGHMSPCSEATFG